MALFIPKIEILVPSIDVAVELRRRGVVIYYMRKHEEGVVICVSNRHESRLADYPILRRFSIYTPLMRLVLPVTLLIFVLMIVMNRVTINYEVKGNLTEDEVVALDALLDEHFYNVGPFEFLKTSETDILQSLEDYFNEFVWININKRGTDLVINLYDIEGGKEEIDFQLSDTLYAKRSGVVQDYVVDTCRVLVSLNQFVREGDPLVSCYVEHPYTNEAIPLDQTPKGEVYANTWYEVTVTAKKSYEEATYTTNNMQTYTFNVFGNELTLPWGEVPYENYETRSKKLDPFFFMKASPLYLEKKKYYEKSDIIKENTSEDILANLDVLVARAFANYTDQEVVIKEMKILSEEETEDEIIVLCHLTVYENIAY